MTDTSRHEITTLFFDLGGVLLTNGWDRHMRRKAADQFGLDWDDLQDRHEQVLSDLETGRLSFERYLQHTVFYRPREFSLDEFRQHVLAQSKPHDAALGLVRSLAASGRYFIGTINNESLELNRYRIERFGLSDVFDLFVSSCYVRLRKPDPAIYRLALQLTDRKPAECVFVDDRMLNLESAAELGINVIHHRSGYQDAGELRTALGRLGVGDGR